SASARPRPGNVVASLLIVRRANREGRQCFGSRRPKRVESGIDLAATASLNHWVALRISYIPLIVSDVNMYDMLTSYQAYIIIVKDLGVTQWEVWRALPSKELLFPPTRGGKAATGGRK